ncbi:cadherin-23 [Stomoxys calcitrans]|uniref:Cadherin domain-containing protein n=1 Tax=Stomoxys calcitrans TaxID=35570 RepID=A0A1I8NNR5_STOCA|nr:cadherin-23 [Stomoxys calcitrans]XP_059223294.1 cadherin-23 [Stomoxys calcitrans]
MNGKWIWWSSDHFLVLKSQMLKMFWYAVLLLFCVPWTTSQFLNQPPHFVPGSGDMSRFSLSENSPVGSPVYQLRGIDPEGSRLKYSISGPVFSVDRDTGVVRLRQELDRETQDTVEVIISITDEGVYSTEPNTVSLRRVIPIRDYNDNQPTFVGRPYLASVSEELAVGTELTIEPKIIVVDRDVGINAEVEIKCVEENDICDTFDVRTEKISDGNYTAHIVLKKSLDFESRPNYIMTISASDGAFENRLSSDATVSITVLDVQDQLPVFTNAPYSATVDENTPAGVSVLTIKAIDGDVGIPRDILLTLEDDDLGHFDLMPYGDPKEGTAVLITTGLPLDRENPDILQNGGVYILNVRATEMIDGTIPAESSTTQITIVVNDVDDHLPEFNGDSFNISIPENLGNGMPLPGLSVVVNDPDMGNNSRYSLILRDVRNSNNTFAVSPTEAQGRTPIVVKVVNSSHLDYDVPDLEKRSFSFDVLALVNGEEKSKVRINVQLTDVNDNPPIFEHSSYRFLASENLTVDSQIGMVRASDKDSAGYGFITYYLKGFGAENFYTDPLTGGFYIKKPLDYEKQNSYSLSIVAEDGGGREANAQVYIEVLDVNDNYPKFEQAEYSRTIREGTGHFEPQFNVRATDIDGPSQGGGKVRYAIVSENSISGNVFSINEDTGEILLQKVARSMDTEKGEYELVVSATDFGMPPLLNTTKVYIRVGISGNQRPIFKGHFQNIENVPVLGPPSYRVSIPENAQAGHNVTMVKAHDPDGLDGLLRYRIVGANDNFEIDEISGLITVSPQARLDRDSNMDSFEITVNAVDSGLPIPETATTTVYVNVKDINDEKPKFEQHSYVAHVSERAEIGESVLKVKAIDKDLHSKLNYTIKGPIKATSKAGVSSTNNNKYQVENAFRIDPDTGIIYVNGKLNHDEAAIVILPIEVKDLNAEVDPEGQIDVAEVTIYVQSFKDTNPVFVNKGWTSSKPVVHVNVMEEMPIDSTLFTLHANDPVTQLPIQSFELVEPKELEYFQLHERSGEVSLRKRLDYEALAEGQTEFHFQVKAHAPDLQRSTTTLVNVTVQNVNDNSPIFEEASYHTSILENSKPSTKLIQVKANDKDAALTERDERLGYHKISYSLYGENSHLFEINAQTGEIVIAANQTVDRERTPRINLQVKAEDSPGRPPDSKQSVVDLTIDVLDVNDNAPVWSQEEYTTVIPENAPSDTFVIKMLATDLDDGPGGEVSYEIIDEGDVNGLFKINKITGEIKTKRELTGKGRAEPFEIHVRAQDNGDKLPKQKSLSADVKLVIYIGDVSANDGIPYFVEPKIGQMVNVTENLPAGTAVFQVRAADPDDPTAPSGILFYKIIDATSDAESFTIDENTGLISTTEILDRENKDMYNIILEVYDNGQPRQSATRVLQVMVLDVDDHKPRFPREVDEGPLQLMVLEEEPEGTIVGNFSAIDEDIGENAAIDYIITEGNEQNIFSIERDEDNMAILRTTQPIDREAIESLTLTVKCLKLGAAHSGVLGEPYDRFDSSQRRIMVKIIDVDDNLPQFEHDDMSVGIRINVPVDSKITTIHAKDLDAEAQPILLTIENVTFVPQFYKRSRQIETTSLHGLFALNNRTGELRTSGSFADYVDGYFNMRIRANNSELPKRHTFNNLKIFVIRDKSLLKFVFSRPPNEIQNFIRPFQEMVKQKMKPLGLDLHILDTQVLTRPDFSLDFSASSSCFQLFKNGSAISMAEMQKLMDSPWLKRELFDIYVEYGVSEVEPCSVRKQVAAASYMTAPGTWLVIIAAFIGLAAIITACTACCLRRKYKIHSKRSLQQASRSSTESYGVVGVPTVYLPYAEPIYGPL